MQSLEALRAWCLAHPSEVIAFAYAALNLLVALVPLRYHTHPLFGLVLRALTRLAALTPPDAPGTLKAPGAGVEAPQAKPGALTKREGFARIDVVCFVGGMLGGLAFLVSLSGCPMPPPDGCTPMATRCSPAGVPQRCSQTQRWSSGSLASCGGSATCCLARSPWGRSVHACVPRAQCIPEPTLADALVEAAVDAALEGGAQ